MISWGTNEILNIYDIKSKDKKQEIDFKNWVNNITSIDDNNIYICTKNSIILYKSNKGIGKQNFQYENNNRDKNYLYIIKNNSDFYYCCEDGVNLANREMLFNIKNKLMKSAIEIFDNLLIFKSNKIVSNGEDKLFFFNSTSKKEISI